MRHVNEWAGNSMHAFVRIHLTPPKMKWEKKRWHLFSLIADYCLKIGFIYHFCCTQRTYRYRIVCATLNYKLDLHNFRFNKFALFIMGYEYEDWAGRTECELEHKTRSFVGLHRSSLNKSIQTKRKHVGACVANGKLHRNYFRGHQSVWIR